MILVVDMNFKKNSLGFEEFVLPLVSLVERFSDVVTCHYSELTSFLLKKAEKVVLSGTPLKNSHYLNNLAEFEWIKEWKKPLLGICAGMQVTAKIFGSELKRCVEIGMTKIKTVKENPLFSGSFEAYELHSLSVEPSKGFEILAISDKCIQALKHKRKAIYCVLFHPEVRNREIVESFAISSF